MVFMGLSEENKSRILAASADRDRVSDAVKALALALVVLGHSLAWTRMPDGSVANTLDAAPALFPLTWALQILPLFFFLAGRGMSGLTTPGTPGSRFYGRIDRLLSPAALLLLITFVLAVALIPLDNPTVSTAAGILPVQLTWFLGVYLILVALAPLLSRITYPAAILGWLMLIGGIDWVRVNVNESAGWLNLILVWALFTILGFRLERLRKLSRTKLVLGLVTSVACAIILIIWGPYSPALISTAALPGISNLAPPTLVLAFAGLAQICLLLLTWPLLERFMYRDSHWIPVAIFASRAMQIYLYHMLFLALGIGVILLIGGIPEPLGLMWWLQHLTVLLVTAIAVWFLSPFLAQGSKRIVDSLSRLYQGPRTPGRRPPAQTLAAISGTALLMVSEGGLGSPMSVRLVLGVPVIPVIVLVLIFIAMAYSHARGRVIDESNPS